MATKHTSAGNGWQAITHHPLFATVVPLWLAATFALSTLAIRGELIEHAVLSSQLDLILPMATPPLGTTARLLLAVGFGLLGGLIGWVVVRVMTPRGAFSQTAWQQARHDARRSEDQRAARPLRRRSADAHPDFPARQPIQAHAELGAHGFDNHPSDQPAPEPAPQVVEAAPAPGYAPPPPVAESWQVLHDVLPPPPPAEEPSWDWKPQPVAANPVVTSAAINNEPVLEKAEAPVSQPFRFFQIDPAPVAQAVTAPVAEMMGNVAVMDAPVIKTPVIEAVAEVAPSVVQPITPRAAAPKTCAGFPSLTLEGPSAAEHIASPSLESLSHVELLERLALALQRHQAVQPDAKTTTCEPALASAPDGTGDALRAALASLRDVK